MSFAPTYGPPKTARPAALPARGFVAPATAPSATQTARYRDAELASATAGQLVVMLFDRMLLTLRRAKLACEANDVESRTVSIVKVSEMVTELRGNLDFELGGDISVQLDALYGYMLRELFTASRTADTGRLDVVARMAAELREAFAHAVASGAGAQPAARIA